MSKYFCNFFQKIFHFFSNAYILSGLYGDFFLHFLRI